MESWLKYLDGNTWMEILGRDVVIWLKYLDANICNYLKGYANKWMRCRNLGEALLDLSDNGQLLSVWGENARKSNLLVEQKSKGNYNTF